MAVTAEIYNHTPRLLNMGALNGTLKIALVDSAYTFDAAHTQWADISANEISGTGYTSGGATVSGLAVTTVDTDDAMADASDTTFSAATLTCRRAVLYYSGTLDGLTNPPLVSYLLDSTPDDVSVTGVDLSLLWATTGIFRATV